MNRLVFAAGVIGTVAATSPTFAQTIDATDPPVGKQAETFLIRVRAIGVSAAR